MNTRKIALLLALAVITTTAYANQKHVISKYFVKGQVATGANRFLDEPLWFMEGGLGSASFSFVFAYNPDGEEPLPLTRESPKKTILATGLDSNFLAALGMTASDIEQRFLNQPFKDVQVNVNPFTGEKESVPNQLDAEPGTISRSGPTKDITLADWLKGNGKMKIKCLENGTSKVKITVSGLVPDGVYTAWALFSKDVTGDGIDDLLDPIPFGGVPNVIIPDKQGNAVFKRTLGYCPNDEPNFQFIDITYHSDGNVYGGNVDLILPGFPAFSVTNTHLAFPVNAKPLE